ncbi:MAG: HAD family phosphatase, partial [Candidatus Peribacteraceae bacterium]|nr:HAD family phosphatase [Candidatus Peribacteraceae bacterium]
MKAVIFDFDGVIVDSERYWRREEKSLFSSIVPNWNYEDNAKIVGMTIPGTYNFIRRNYEINISLEEFLEVYKDLSRRVYDQCAIIDGVTDLLKQLEEGGIQIAVASSAPGKWVHKILKDLN